MDKPTRSGDPCNLQATEGSITSAIEGMAKEQAEAADILWHHYFDRLCSYANRHVTGRDQRTIDPEAIASSSLQALFQGIESGRFSKLNNRDQLWQLVTKIAMCKTSNAKRFYRSQRRGGGSVRGDSAFHDIGNTQNKSGTGDLANPAELVEVASCCEAMLRRLPSDQYREIALLRLAGYSNEEIASAQQCTTRTVERKLVAIRMVLAKVYDLD